MKLTPWFRGDVLPVRIGYYQRKWEMPADTKSPDFWDGSHWYSGYRDESVSLGPSFYQDLKWRGLAEKP